MPGYRCRLSPTDLRTWQARVRTPSRLLARARDHGSDGTGRREPAGAHRHQSGAHDGASGPAERRPISRPPRRRHRRPCSHARLHAKAAPVDPHRRRHRSPHATDRDATASASASWRRPTWSVHREEVYEEIRAANRSAAAQERDVAASRRACGCRERRRLAGRGSRADAGALQRGTSALAGQLGWNTTETWAKWSRHAWRAGCPGHSARPDGGDPADVRGWAYACLMDAGAGRYGRAPADATRVLLDALTAQATADRAEGLNAFVRYGCVAGLRGGARRRFGRQLAAAAAAGCRLRDLPGRVLPRPRQGRAADHGLRSRAM